jgi:hypothetical protein
MEIMKANPLKGVLFNASNESYTSGATVELWASTGTYDFMLARGTTRENGEFCLVLEEKDFDALRNDTGEHLEGVTVQLRVVSEDSGHQACRILNELYNGDPLTFDFSEGAGTYALMFTTMPGDLLLALDPALWPGRLLVVHRPDVLDTPRFRFVFKAVREDDRSPVANRSVRTDLVLNGHATLPLGTGMTDSMGHLAVPLVMDDDFAVLLSNEMANPEMRFRLTIEGAEGDEGMGELLYDTSEFENDDDSGDNSFQDSLEVIRRYSFQVFEVQISLPPTDETYMSLDISELTTNIGLSLSPVLTAELAASGLTSLQEIRDSGFINAEDFENDGDKDAVAILNAHAQLELTTEDVQLRHFYIQAGYKSIGIIAKSMRHDFILAGEEYTEVNELEKAKLFEAANAQFKVLNNVLMHTRVGAAYKNYEGPSLNNNGHDHLCKCEDCMAAVSPLAYLADLLKYTTEHIKKDGTFVSIGVLQNTFKQPFGDLPASCEEMNRKLCQYRIGVEILRAYLISESTNTCQDTNLERVEREYLQHSYFTLLRLMGTSFDEIRKAYAVAPDERETELRPLARRLGITFTPVRTGIIAINPSNHSVPELRNTMEVEGNHRQAVIDAGRFRVLDHTNSAYNKWYTLAIPVSVEYVPDIDPSAEGKTVIKVSGSIPVPTQSGLMGYCEVDTIRQLFLDPKAQSGLYEITEERLELIFGLRDSNRAPLADQPEAFVLKWKLIRLREMWASEDHPLDDFTLRKLPIIDPDLIGPDDFRYPETGNDAYDLWTERRGWLDNDVLPTLMDDDNHTPWGVSIGVRGFSVNADLTGVVLPGQQVRVVHQADIEVVYTVTTVVFDGTDSVVSVVEPIQFTTVEVFIIVVRERILTLENTPVTPPDFIGRVTIIGNQFLLDHSASVGMRIRGSSSNDDIYAIDTASLNPSNQLEFKLYEALPETDVVDGYAVLEFDLTVLPSVNVTILTVSGQQISVLDVDSSVLADINAMDAGEIAVIGSISNDGDYDIPDNAASPNGLYTIIDIDNTTIIPTVSETGSISYPKTVPITGVELGNRTFVINGHDLSEILSASDSVTVSGSSGNDNDGEEYTVNDVSIVEGSTRVKVDEAIPSATANGTLDLAFAIIKTGNVLTVSDIDLTAFISDGDVIRIRVGTDTVSLTVSLEPTFGSATEITIVSSDGVNTDDLLILSFPISEVDIRNKCFQVAGDYRDQVFPGYQIIVPETSPPPAERHFTVELVTSNRIFVVESILHVGYTTFVFQRLVPISKRKPNVVEVLETMASNTFNVVSGTPPWDSGYDLEDLEHRAKELRLGLNMEDHTEYILENLNLPVDAFLALMAIVKKDKDSTGNSANEPVTDKEWEEFFNILVLAVKNNLTQNWTEAEETDNITLDPRIFWLSLRDPKPGNWPGESPQAEPLIDPQLISRSELTELTAGADAEALFHARREMLEELLDRLNDMEFGNFSTEIARYIFGSLTEADDPLRDLRTVRTALNSTSDSVSAAARSFIVNELRLSEQDFNGLMGYFDRLDSQGYHPTGVDKAVYHPMLVRVYKLRRLYPVWRHEEMAYGFFLLRKAQLPTWRASSRLRSRWQDALRLRSSMPSIDPDTTRAEDFSSYNSNAFTIWGVRRSAVQVMVDELEEIVIANDFDRISEMISHALEFNTGTVASDVSLFDRVREDEKAGIDISKRLAQLTLEFPAYRRLLHLREVAELPDTDNLLYSEWVEVVSILSNVMKRRLYAEWRHEESSEGITLSQDFFRGSITAFYDHPFQPSRIQLWRLTYQERMNWQRTLLSRIENEEKMIEAHHGMIIETEELTLRILRDGLIQAAGDPDKFWAENAEDLTTRFMFDFKTTCCQRTTRVSSAIDTLQMLNWSEATGLLERGPHNFTLIAPKFEAEWKWIGSYATWRSAMFVFLFPDNLLYPPLKREQSPAFRKLAEDLRGNPRITPETACQAAHEYSKYWEEVCNLELEVTCNALTIVAKGNCDTQFISAEKYLHYTFAKNISSSKIYYTVGQSRRLDADGQGFWSQIDGYGTNVARLLGAIPVKTKDNERYIFLIAVVNEKGEQKFTFLKFNLNTQSWDEEYQTLDLPEWADLSYGNVVIAHEEHEPETIRVIVRPIGKDFEVTGLDHLGFPDENETRFFTNEIDATVGGWKNEEWQHGDTRFLPSIKKNKPAESPKILASFDPSWQPYSLYRFKGEYYVGSWTFGRYAQRIDLHTGANHKHYDYIGALPQTINNKRHLFLFFRDENGNVTQSKLNLVGIANALNNPPNFTAEYGPWHPEPYLHFGHFCRYHILSTPFVSAIAGQYRIKFIDLYDNGWGHVPIRALQHLDILFSQNPILLIVDGVPQIGGVQIMSELYRHYVTRPTHGRAITMYLRIANASSSYIHHGPAGQLSNIKLIAPNAGRKLQGPNGKYRLSACQFRNNRNAIYRFEDGTFLLNAHVMSGPTGNSLLRISPVCLGPYHLASNLTSGVLQMKKTILLDTYLDNANEPIQVLNEYVWEAAYFTPMLIGLTLQERGHYQEALNWFSTVYDYRQQDVNKRKIWHGLVVEESYSASYDLNSDWLLDPMNPHQLAKSRPNSYTRYTLLAIIRCMLEFADAEFTVDTVESVSRARELYRHALQLLDAPELELKEDDCRCKDLTEEIIRRVACELTPEQLAEWQWAIRAMAEQFEEFNTCGHATDIIDSIVDLILEDVDNPEVYVIADILANIEDTITLATPAKSNDTMSLVIETGSQVFDTYSHSVLTDRAVQKALTITSLKVGYAFTTAARHVTGVAEDSDLGYEWLTMPTDSGKLPVGHHAGKLDFPAEQFDDPTARTTSGMVKTLRFMFPGATLGLWFDSEDRFVPAPNHYFCIPDNPVISALRMRAELNLFKLRNCMNIAGMKRELDPYAAPTDTVSGLPMIGAGGQLVLPGNVRIRPTLYRYEVIIERAKQLVAHAQQMEANFLAALEKRDAEYYNRLKARQDLNLSKAQVKLQDLRVKVAEGEVRMAELQRDRAQLQVEELQGMIDEGLLGPEMTMIGLYSMIAMFNQISAGMGNVLQAMSASTFLAMASAAVGTAKTVLDILAIEAQKSLNITQLHASQARREQEWGYQINMANHDIAIGNQGIAVAQSRLRVSGQEKRISELQVEHAEATLDFLSTKFTNVDLYDWMGRVLEGVYAYFLQQATATAKMAQGQLAFERQELPPGLIQDDYWEVPTDSMAVATVGSGSADRRGMTGSARLLQDITKLDQYAFDTEKRRLQITRTFSLAHLAPIEFQRFRETGELTFLTAMEHFDRDFPGHFLRLIKEVRVSVIALTPSTEGIRATLTSSGVSRVVIGGDTFQSIAVRRDPEVIAFSGTRDANGLFQLQSNERLMRPYEASGVEMLWKLDLPKESNRFDYGTIADVLFTIDYTALHDYAYQQQVLRTMPPFHSADIPLSFRSDLADQFYLLGNPEPVGDSGAEDIEAPVTVSFDMGRANFPPNLVNDSIRIREFKLYFATDDGESIGSDHLIRVDLNTGADAEPDYLDAKAVDNLISTASASGGGLIGLRNREPFGTWHLQVPRAISDLIRDQKITDIIMVITFSGDYPGQPSSFG